MKRMQSDAQIVSNQVLERAKALPAELQEIIISFVPEKPKPKHPAGLQRELEKLQKSPKRTPLDLKGLDDFVIH
jgi:hypothetical protein